MRAILVSNGFQPNYEKAFANGLARNGVEVTLVSSDRTLVCDLDASIRTAPLRGSQNPQRGRLQKAWGLVAYTARLFGYLFTHRRHVLHMTGMFITASVPLGLLEVLGYRLLSRRFLLTIHNLLPHDQHTRFNAWVLRVLYRIPHVLVVHTEKMRDALVNEWGVEPERIVVMEHGVDDMPECAASWQPDPEGSLRLLMFGLVARYKGIDIALAALEGLSDFAVSLSIVGMCRDSALAAELDALIARVPHPHRASWQRAYVEENAVQSIFEQADAVLLPYRHIDQSGVLLTAYRFGIPVLAFDVGSFARYVTPETGIVISDRTAGGLQHGLRMLHRQLSQFDRDRVRDVARRYQWENTVRVLLPYYA
jgi:glycosyltransferase involved in cell wall biosynthesis